MKLISWNVNGLRAAVTKGFMESFNELDADIFCLQETKLQPDQISLELPGYEQYWKYAEKNNIPTSDNIHRSINDLLKNKLIKIANIPDEFLIKSNKTINKKAYSRNKYMREIILE
mgnify:CR=1 FL=1